MATRSSSSRWEEIFREAWGHGALVVQVLVSGKVMWVLVSPVRLRAASHSVTSPAEVEACEVWGASQAGEAVPAIQTTVSGLVFHWKGLYRAGVRLKGSIVDKGENSLVPSEALLEGRDATCQLLNVPHYHWTGPKVTYVNPDRLPVSRLSD